MRREHTKAPLIDDLLGKTIEFKRLHETTIKAAPLKKGKTAEQPMLELG